MWASLGHFLITPYRNRYLPKPMEFCQIKPYSIVGDCFMPFFHSLIDIKMILIYHQQAPPILPFCSSLSKDKLSDDSGVVLMLSFLKSTHAFKQELSTKLE
jgi:hypothetical protein